ncbi:hypothetical protein IAQ61_010888 [Plenodomus lingam]|uniref:uncharacterized protein n=1 Tax=Leptosphaeria maculans TaxID=5022 RepID=UPI00331DCF84|nr:hypothetical protein IAQ61_010888 [Plenodomus lingam]
MSPGVASGPEKKAGRNEVLPASGEHNDSIVPLLQPQHSASRDTGGHIEGAVIPRLYRDVGCE